MPTPTNCTQLFVKLIPNYYEWTVALTFTLDAETPVSFGIEDAGVAPTVLITKAALVRLVDDSVRYFTDPLACDTDEDLILDLETSGFMTDSDSPLFAIAQRQRSRTSVCWNGDWFARVNDWDEGQG